MKDRLKEAMVDHGRWRDGAALPMDTSTFGAGGFLDPLVTGGEMEDARSTRRSSARSMNPKIQ